MLSWFKKKNTPNAPAAAPPTTHPHPQASVDKSPFLDQAKYFSTILRQSPKIIFDVGANIGDTSAQFAKIFPDAQIFAFEPCEETFQQLSTRFADTPQIHPLQLALSETHGRSQFFTYRNSAVNSLLPIYENSPVDSPDDVKDKIVCTVHTQTIDAFMAESGIDRVDILKLDVQGGETRALNGATQALA